MKRMFDLAIAVLTLVILMLPFGLLVWAVRRKLGSPVFFFQERSGLYGAPFRMVKFRTMTSETGPSGELLPDVQRLTPFGRWLRATSLDELPELWNVITGEMSLVGPRPFLMQYLPLYSPYQARRHEVRPGITGWAQINGRNAISWDEKFRLDVWYVDNNNLCLDIKILWGTVRKVIIREHISPGNEVIMPSFKGSQDLNSKRKLK